jgi:hypothetical protein
VDTADQFFDGRILDQISLSASPKRAINVLFALKGSENDKTGGGIFLTNLSYGLDPVHHGHAEIQQGDVGMSRGKLFHCFAPVLGLANDLHVTPITEQPRQPGAYNRVIICDQHFETTADGRASLEQKLFPAVRIRRVLPGVRQLTRWISEQNLVDLGPNRILGGCGYS